MASESVLFILMAVGLPWTTFADNKFPDDCGRTRMYPRQQIVGGNKIPPDEYPWLASLQYGRKETYGYCSGNVINTQYLLTAAHCVNGSHYFGSL